MNMQVVMPVELVQLSDTRLLRKSILKVLAYFDMFSYPLSATEIRLFLDRSTTEEELTAALDQLVSQDCVFHHDGFYLLRNEPALVSRRKDGNSRAARMLTKAQKISSFLYWFPYVRGIGISGSLSKNFASKDADIDFFIITQSNRLWVARTFMHLFKKLTFLAGKQHWFCMNYYVDEHAMKIQEQNIFTATEVVTLLPTHGNGVLTNFFGANEWIKEYFPNQSSKVGNAVKPKEAFIKRSIEFCLNNEVGNRLDDYLMQLTTKRWKQKETVQQTNARGRRMGLCTGKHFARPNPEFFQKKILMLFQEKVQEVEKLTDS
ncbi:MAG TPA: hypothetical protein VGD17_18850 [Chitinophagaceae bacterium]